MDITVYLPDEIGKRAKEAQVNFSQLLRGAVEEELERRAARAETLDEVETYEVYLESGLIGRITGKLIAFSHKSEDCAYLTVDERVLMFDASKQQVEDVSDDPVGAFEGWFDHDEDAYVQAMQAIGEKPVVNL